MRLLNETVRWGVKSVGGLAANLALLTVWVELAGVPAEYAVALNWLLISVAGYVVTDRWVFQAAETPGGVRANLRRYLGMQSVMALSKGVNYALYLALLWAGVEYHVAWVAGAVVVFVVTFAGNRLLWHGLEIPQST